MSGRLLELPMSGHLLELPMSGHLLELPMSGHPRRRGTPPVDLLPDDGNHRSLLPLGGRSWVTGQHPGPFQSLSDKAVAVPAERQGAAVAAVLGGRIPTPAERHGGGRCARWQGPYAR